MWAIFFTLYSMSGDCAIAVSVERYATEAECDATTHGRMVEAVNVLRDHGIPVASVRAACDEVDPPGDMT